MHLTNQRARCAEPASTCPPSSAQICSLGITRVLDALKGSSRSTVVTDSQRVRGGSVRAPWRRKEDLPGGKGLVDTRLLGPMPGVSDA